MALIVADRVQETSTTTGTGALTLAAAVTGSRRFSAVMSTSDTCYYLIVAVDGNGNPSGDWECGLGTYSGTNTLTRTTVHASSNAGSAVSFAAGTKYVFLDATATYLTTPPVLTIDTVSGTSHTFATADGGKHKRFTSGSAITATVPPNSSDAIPIGTRIRCTAAGAGQVTLTPGSGVTLNSRGSALKSTAQYAVFEIEKVATNEWDVLGDLTT
jgi:hypothetical protein